MAREDMDGAHIGFPLTDLVFIQEQSAPTKDPTGLNGVRDIYLSLISNWISEAKGRRWSSRGEGYVHIREANAGGSVNAILWNPYIWEETPNIHRYYDDAMQKLIPENRFVFQPLQSTREANALGGVVGTPVKFIACCYHGKGPANEEDARLEKLKTILRNLINNSEKHNCAVVLGADFNVPKTRILQLVKDLTTERTQV